MKPLRISRDSLRVAAVVVAALIFIAAAYMALRAVDSAQVVAAGGSTSVRRSDVISVGGEEYKLRSDVSAVLLLGIDEDGPVASSGSYNNSGQADFLALVVFDHQKKEYSVLQLNRDTMTTIQILGINGRNAGERTAQLALAHTYGSGLQDSCRNTAQAVSGLLCGFPVNNYLAFNMDAVSIINDLVGGVTVQITDDFSDVDGSLRLGETVTLEGEHALKYVRARSNMKQATNLARMERQRTYFLLLSEELRKAVDGDDAFVLKALDAVGDYMVTNCTSNELSQASEDFSDYAFAGIISPDGESAGSAKYVEFYIDQIALEKIVLNLFCERQ